MSFGRGARCQEARAQSSSDSRSPKGSAGPSCFAGQARCSCCNLPLFLRLRALRPLPWWPLLLDAAGETASLSLVSRRSLFLFAARSSLFLSSLSALSRVSVLDSFPMLHAVASPSSLGRPLSCCTGTLRTPSTLLAAAHSACTAPADTSCTSCTLATQCETRSTQPPSAPAARSTPPRSPRSPRSRFSPLAAIAPEPASCMCICGWNCCCSGCC